MFRRDSKKMDLGGAQDNHNNRKDQAYAQLGLGTFGCCRAFRESFRCLASVNMASVMSGIVRYRVSRMSSGNAHTTVEPCIRAMPVWSHSFSHFLIGVVFRF